MLEVNSSSIFKNQHGHWVEENGIKLIIRAVSKSRKMVFTKDEKLINDWENEGKPQAVLWAGQPETEDALITLNQIMPIIKSFGIKFLFKSNS